MLLLYTNTSEVPQYPPEEQKAAMQAWQNYRTEAEAAGVYVSSSGLAPVSTATTVRVRDGKRLTSDGPFAETHEQLGGFFMLNCKDLDEAIDWAARVPGFSQYGSVEVRPLWSPEA